MKLKFYDWVVFGVLALVAFSGGSTVALLAVIAGLLYLIVRRYFSTSKTAGIAMSPPEVTEFVVHDSDKDGVTDRVAIAVDVDINLRPAPGHFRLRSRFEQASGKGEYEYRIEGTSVSVRLLNCYDDGEMAHFEKDWEVRDGVVLESDLRARFEAGKFNLRPVEENIAAFKSQTQWQELKSWSFNGLKYFLLNRCLPASDARRYLRQELERLKLGIARATQEYAAYGVEPDPNPESVDGWRWIGGKKPENAKDMEPLWNKIITGAFGTTEEETGRYGRQLIVDLQKLLGD